MAEYDLLSTYIAERDLDFLFLEEFNCNESFQRWFWRKTHLETGPSAPLESFIQEVKAIHSVSEGGEGYGETDILVDYHVKEPAGQPVRFLVENKIIAPFGPGQIERYRKRSWKYEHHKKCKRCFTVLLAPECYYKDSPLFQDAEKKAFDFIVSYDEVRGFLEDLKQREGVTESSRRYFHKIRILEQAIEKSRRGYVAINDPVTQEFNVKYFQFALDQSLDIGVRNPGTKSVPAGSRWFYLKHHSLKKHPDLPELKLVHKIGPGHDRLDLQFTGWGKYDAIVRPKLEPLLEYRMKYIVTTNQHTVIISIPLIPIDIQKPFEEESSKVHAALGEANRLINWLERNREPLLAISREIQNQENRSNTEG